MVNMRLQQSMGDLYHNRLVTARTDIPRRTDIDAPVPTARTRTFCSAGMRVSITGVAASVPSTSWKLTTSSRSDPVDRTTSRTCSCRAPIATGSRVTGCRSN